MLVCSVKFWTAYGFEGALLAMLQTLTWLKSDEVI